MAMCIFKIVLLCLYFTLPNGSRRYFRDVYQPYGPKMCLNMTEDSTHGFVFVTEDLACRLNSVDDSDNQTQHGLSICTNQRRTNYTLFDLPAVMSICYAYPEDKSLPYLQPHPNSDSKHSRAVQSAKRNCTALLHQACEKGELCVVKHILSNGLANINSRGKLGRTPVMLAARRGHLDIYNFLVSQGCNLSSIDNNLNTVLHVACMGGNVDIVREVLFNKPEYVESKEKRGWTPMLESAFFGHEEVMDFLIGEGCNLTVVDNNRNTILHLVCIRGKVTMVRYILQMQIVDIESRDRYGKTPVMKASLNGHVEVVALLEREGCNMRAVDNYRYTVLHRACIGGSVEMVKYILSKQIIDIDNRASQGSTPLMCASRTGRIEIAKLLVSQGSDMRTVNDNKDNILHGACLRGKTEMVKYILSKQIINIESRGMHGRTPVLKASYVGNVAIVKILIDEGCFVKAVDDYKDNILHVACNGGKVEMVNYILSNKMVGIESRGMDGVTPALKASWSGYVAVVKFLLSKGSDMRAVTDYNDTILHAACFSGKTEMVKYILSLQIIDIESRGRYGMTPVMSASHYGHINVIKLLVSTGCDMGAVDDYKDNILHKASYGGHIELVKYILSKEVININSRGENGKTPVMGAAENGHMGILKYLKSKDCNMATLDDNRNNLLHVACEYGQVGIVKYLIKLGVPYRGQRNKYGHIPRQTALVNKQTNVVHLLE